MKIQRKDTKIISEVTYNQWKGFKNKTAYSVLDWGELLMVREIKPYGERKELSLMDKDHGTNMVKQYPHLYDFRKGNQEDLTKLSLKHIILETYEKDLTFDDFFFKKFGSKSTREFTKVLLKELYAEGEISSLPIDFDSKTLILRSKTIEEEKNQAHKSDSPVINKELNLDNSLNDSKLKPVGSKIIESLKSNAAIAPYVIMIFAILNYFKGCS